MLPAGGGCEMTRPKKKGELEMDWTRRDLLATSGAFAILLATGGCEKIKQNIKNRPIRRNIAKLDPNSDEIKAYRDGVAAMKGLAASDPRSWAAQANIHLEFCPHGNWYFLPWHRCYLLCFERIIQKLLNKPDFGLPYWNWQTAQSIPAPFWQAGSPLLHSPRSATSSSVANDSIVGQANIASILAESDFETFASYAATALRGGGGAYGRLEGSPHNYVHGFVGGTMGTFLSPLDPVFWCHHNIIDYQWKTWNQDLGHPNTNDAQWSNFDLNGMFVDGDGNPANFKVGATPLMPLLNYQFEPDTIGSGTSMASDADTDAGAKDEAALRKFLEEGAPVRFRELSRTAVADGVTVSPGRAATVPVDLQPAQLDATMDAAPSERTFVRLGNASAPADEGYFVRVFLNKPDATPETPISDPAYAGSFAFFSDPRVMRMTPDFQVEISDSLRAAAGQTGLQGRGSLTFVPVPVEANRAPAAQPLSIGRVALVTSALDPEPARQ
jgi:tyrosinase